jgi:hypothetical protein
LGEFYIEGWGGLPKNDASALKWFRLGAEQGEPGSMNGYGMMLATGRATAQNLAQAAMWFKRAAELGTPNAMHSLARMQYEGKGVPRDLAKSYYWTLLALRYYPANAPQAEALRTHLAAVLKAQLSDSARKTEESLALGFMPGKYTVAMPAPVLFNASPDTVPPQTGVVLDLGGST